LFYQSKQSEYRDLTQNEQLNVLADALAKQKLTQFATTVNWRFKRPIHIPYEQCLVDWTNQFGIQIHVSSHLQKTLQSKILGVAAREYWKKKKTHLQLSRKAN
jgi:hypothetical protein